MKKFLLALAVALPMFFATSCGDDNDDVDIYYSMPLLTKNNAGDLQISNNSITLEWGEDLDDVAEAMRPFSYVLNQNVSTSKTLAYTYDSSLAMPFYIYTFVGNGLAASSITISEEQDDQVDFDQYFKDNGYKDVTTDDDDDFVYRSKDKLTLVHYGYDGNVTVIWTLNNGTRSTSALYDHLEVVKALLNE